MLDCNAVNLLWLDLGLLCPPQELQQGRYELRVKLDICQAQWESQVSELERDVQELQAQVDTLNQTLSEAESEKTRLKHEHSEQSQRLREQLQTVSDTLYSHNTAFQASLLPVLIVSDLNKY